MIIDIDSQTRIKGTAACWQLEREHVTKGAKAFKPISYHSTFHSAVSAAAEREIRTHHAHGVDEAITAVRETLAKYQTVLHALPSPAD